MVLSGSNNNTFSGGVTINSGTLKLTSSGGGLGTGTITINDGTLNDNLNGTGIIPTPSI